MAGGIVSSLQEGPQWWPTAQGARGMEMKTAVFAAIHQLQQVSNALVTFHGATVRTKLFKIQSVKAALSCL